MKLNFCYSCLCLFLFVRLSLPQNVDSVNLFKDISKILSQLRGKPTSDQLRVFNFIRNSVNLIRNKQRSNARFSNKLLPVKGFRSADNNGNFIFEDKKLMHEVSVKNFCLRNTDCPESQGLECKEGRCLCIGGRVQVNGTHCLKGALLGFRCEDHAQCQSRVKSSSCIQGFCRCGAGFAPYRRANCLKGTYLDQKCRTHAQCQILTLGSTCKWIVRNVLGKCQCSAKNPRRGNKCGPPGFALGAPCGRSYDCSLHVPGSICVGKNEPKSPRKPARNQRKELQSKSSHSQYTKIKLLNSTLTGTCQCPKGYLDIDQGSRCVPVSKEVGVSPVSLGQKCLYEAQCKSADPYSTCKKGVCTCTAASSSCSIDNRGCFNGTFQCISNGRCVSSEFVCNGVRDCSDGSDELDCVPGRCSPLAFTCGDGSCITRGLLCDDTPDCPDGSDELECIGTKVCPASTFRCNDGQCLPGFSFCNAKVNCRDKSDEDKMICIGGKFRVQHCPFRCKNSRCRSASVVCSGTDGCGDNSDEERCSVCSCPKP